MKRLLSTLLALTMALALTACAGSFDGLGIRDRCRCTQADAVLIKHKIFSSFADDAAMVKL